MRNESFNPVILGLAFVLSAGCGDDGGAQLTRKPFLPAGTEIDLIRISEAVWAREAAVGVKASTGNLGGAEGAGRVLSATAIATIEPILGRPA